MLKWIDKTFIKPIEESKMGLGTFVLIALGYIVVRNLLQGAFESLHLLGLSSITLMGIEESFLHLTFAWLYLFILIAILLHFTTGHSMRKIAKVLLTYSFIILVPILVDILVRPSGFRLTHPADPNVIVKTLNVIYRPWIMFGKNAVYQHADQLPYGASPGVIVEAFLAVILVIIYSISSAKTSGRKVLAAVLAPVIVLGSVMLASGGQFIMESISRQAAGGGLPVYYSGGLIGSPIRKYAMLIIIPFIFVFSFMVFLINKVKAKMLIKSIDWALVALGAVTAVGGFLLGWLHMKDVLTGVAKNPFDFLAMATLVILGFTVCAAIRYIWFGYGSSNPGSDQKTFRRGAMGMTIFSIALAWCLGYSTLYITLAALFMGALLGISPLRLGRFRIPSALVKTSAVFLLVFTGYSLFATERTFTVFPWQLSLLIFFPLLAIFLVIEFVSGRAAAAKLKEAGNE